MLWEPAMGLLLTSFVPCSPKHVRGCGGTSAALQRRRLPGRGDYSPWAAAGEGEGGIAASRHGAGRRAASPGGSAGSGGSLFAVGTPGGDEDATLGLPGTRGPTAMPRSHALGARPRERWGQAAPLRGRGERRRRGPEARAGRSWG